MFIAAIIPARGGSTRLLKKNLYPVCGRPMIEWSIRACQESEFAIQPWVSSDCPEILAVADTAGARIIKRPPELAKNSIFKQEVICHAAREIEASMGQPDIVISLQPNSPQIRAHHLDAALRIFIEKKKDEIFSVDSDLMQNAAFRIMKFDYVFQRSLSTHCGVFVCNLIDVHTIEDVMRIEAMSCL